MNLEINRIQSFVDKKWPKWRVEISIRRFANAGLFYEGEGDCLRCFSCHGQIRNWKNTDSPKRRHKTEYPQCRFVRGLDARNIPDESTPNTACGKSKISSYPENAKPKHHKLVGLSQNSKNLEAITMFSPSETYRSEFIRLLSFSGWHLTNEIDPYELASSGLYSLGDGTVKCFACFLEISSHQLKVAGESLRHKHKRLSPDCPFVKDRTSATCGNEPITSQQKRLAVLIFQSKYPQYFRERARLATYDNWPKNHPQRPSNLAEAGFFSNGKDDMVTCFHCGCRLVGWEDTDDPWEEHASWSPQCYWLKQERRITKPSAEGAKTSGNVMTK